ncbi:3-oxoacyl-ACP reductase FabG [Couchioplanes azureus]|uniref:3-oxoacyl-ACP reductase FabG n=1 Tax=Couchioplanes caeruleus TaxID=56438 RepID=UPI0018A6CDD3|nr:3-oxoacyl-ACP reductase FabG [Couchioplanes caeruleus]
MARTTLIIGASQGIGRATAEQFIKAGHRVAVTYRRTEPALDALTVQCDVVDTASVDNAFSTVEAALGPVEAVVVNAGITHDTLLMRMGEADFTDVVDTNLTGAYRVAKRASKPMLRARWGRLIFVSSAVALRGEAGQANYAASKAGLIGFARSLARELGSRNITSNVIAPGFTETPMTAVLTDDQRQRMLAQIPAGRPASPTEVAAAVLFLAGDEAAYINGAVIPVDGGAGMGH